MGEWVWVGQRIIQAQGHRDCDDKTEMIMIRHNFGHSNLDMLHCQIEQLLPCANGLSTYTKLSDLISTLAFFWFILQNAETFLYLIRFGQVDLQISLS